jgi:serine/threonine protein kinase
MNEFDLFQKALDIEDANKRKEFLDVVCRDDTTMLHRMESLLESHFGNSQFLAAPVAEQIIDAQARAADTETQSTLDHSESDCSKRPEQAQDDCSQPLDYLSMSHKPGSLGRLGHYEVIDVIGRGAFGTVLRAFDEKLQRLVAIKVLNRELATTSPARKRFIREAQASAGIRHENVVNVFAVEKYPLPYLVMEFVPGQTLHQYLADHGPLDLATVLSLGKQIALGLAAAHSQGLIHRDIKPCNILLESVPTLRAKITDFGLARTADDASLTQSGMIAGTPMFMAPEQALGCKLDQRADLFSLGSVLYQMISGRPPFRATNSIAVLKRVTEDTPRAIREIIPDTPPWLCQIIAKLHAKAPEDRYQSALELANELAGYESRLRTHGAWIEDVPTPSIVKQSRRPLLWVGVSALLVTLAASVLFAVYRPRFLPSPITARHEAQSSPSVNPTLHRFPSNEWIDVIPLLDLTIDKLNIPRVTGKNDWRIENNELAILRDLGGSKLLFPLDAEWSRFECEIEFTRRIGNSGFNVNLPTASGYCPLVFDAPGTPGGIFIGVRAKGHILSEGRKILDSERSTVRILADTAHKVEVEINASKIAAWTGNCDSISSPINEGYPHARRVSLWIHPGGNEFVFHRIRVRTLGDTSMDSLRPLEKQPE